MLLSQPFLHRPLSPLLIGFAPALLNACSPLEVCLWSSLAIETSLPFYCHEFIIFFPAWSTQVHSGVPGCVSLERSTICATQASTGKAPGGRGSLC
jgi:hypothetical protein